MIDKTNMAKINWGNLGFAAIYFLLFVLIAYIVFDDIAKYIAHGFLEVKVKGFLFSGNEAWVILVAMSLTIPLFLWAAVKTSRNIFGNKSEKT